MKKQKIKSISSSGRRRGICRGLWWFIKAPVKYLCINELRRHSLRNEITWSIDRPIDSQRDCRRLLHCDASRALLLNICVMCMLACECRGINVSCANATAIPPLFFLFRLYYFFIQILLITFCILIPNIFQKTLFITLNFLTSKFLKKNLKNCSMLIFQLFF